MGYEPDQYRPKSGGLPSLLSGAPSRYSAPDRYGRIKNLGASELTQEQLAKINEMLLEQGGQISLGRISSTFQGMRMASLEAHFDIVETKSGCHTVGFKGQLQGLDPASLFLPGQVPDRTASNPKQPRFVTDDKLSEICQFVQKIGGKCNLGMLSSQYIGLKKAQLEQFFTFVEVQSGDVDLYLNGHASPGEAEPPWPVCFESVEDMKSQVQDYLAMSGEGLEGSRSLEEVCSAFPGLQPRSLLEHFSLQPDKETGGVKVRTAKAVRTRAARDSKKGKGKGDFEQEFGAVNSIPLQPSTGYAPSFGMTLA